MSASEIKQAVGGLREQRKVAGLSQQRLAELAGCSISMLRLLEAGYEPDGSDVLRRIDLVLMSANDRAADAKGGVHPASAAHP